MPKLLDAFCGPENLAPIVVKIWAGLNAIFGSGRTPPTALAALAVRGCGKISRPANCPALEDQKPGIVPGFLDPSVLSRGAADYQSGGRASGRFLRQPLSQMSRVLNRESVLCQIENDEKQLAVTTMLEKGKKLEKSIGKNLCGTLLAPTSRVRAIVTSGVSVAPSG